MPRRHRRRPYFWLAASTWISALALTSAAAWAGECPPTPGQGKVCTANDFNVTSAVLSGGNGCTEGELFDLDVRIGLEATAS